MLLRWLCLDNNEITGTDDDDDDTDADADCDRCLPPERSACTKLHYARRAERGGGGEWSFARAPHTPPGGIRVHRVPSQIPIMFVLALIKSDHVKCIHDR